MNGRVTIVAMLAVLGGAALATAAPTSSRTISLFSRTTAADLQDKPPAGQSQGDVIVGASQLRNAVAQFGRPKGVVVGRDRFRAVYTRPGVAALRVTVTLPGGTITCFGTAHEDRLRQVLRVVAATGSFAGATGTCEATPAPRNPFRADSLNVYRLRLPD